MKTKLNQFEKFLKPFTVWSGKVATRVAKKKPGAEVTMYLMTQLYSRGFSVKEASDYIINN